MREMRDQQAEARLCTLLAGTGLDTLAYYAGEAYLRSRGHGLTDKWLAMYDNLPPVTPSILSFGRAIQVGQRSDLTEEQSKAVEAAARSHLPWRKGPWSLFGTEIDSEWRSDLKWDRVAPHISPLAGKRILDVGCGNGYHCYRMYGEQARLVVGIDPHLAYYFQYRLMQHYMRELPVHVLPITLEQFPEQSKAFDTVFSMGVLYHRRAPLDHLFQLLGALRPGGELVLETLIVDGPDGYALMPPGRYSRMNNVWFLPSVATTETWLRRCGFKDVRTVDVSVTTEQEQRTTEWMPFQSLIDGLDLHDPTLTVEGLPAPKRAILLATAP